MPPTDLDDVVSTWRTVVLVEGVSDRVALRTLARRRGRDLAADGVEIIAMGGITNVREFASRYGPHGLGIRLAGLYDAPEEPALRRGVIAAGLAVGPGEHGLGEAGLHRCDVDLEDELIRALGVTGVETVIEAEGETPSLQRLAQMPVQRSWTRPQVLRRFLGVRSGRKARYAALLIEALPPNQAPEPLAALLRDV